jgi:CMP-N-acetylneuraminic acid synthetase
MSYKGYKILAVIPARGGSKGIPRKNLCKVDGLSLVARAVKITKALTWIDKVVLSTDDREIAEEGRKYGAEVPFLRPLELAGDTSKSVDVWCHALVEAEKYYSTSFEISILLEPTSPLRQPGDVERTVYTLFNDKYIAAAATVSRTPAHFTPHKCLTVNQEGFIGFYLKDDKRFSIRQKIPKYFCRNGVCYAVKRETLIDKGLIMEEHCAAVIIDRPVVNIDELLDIEFAEFLLERENSVFGEQ